MELIEVKFPQLEQESKDYDIEITKVPFKSKDCWLLNSLWSSGSLGKFDI